LSPSGAHTVTLDDATLTALADGRDGYEFTIRGDGNDYLRLTQTLRDGRAATQTRAGFVEYEGTSGSVFVSDEVDVFLFV